MYLLIIENFQHAKFQSSFQMEKEKLNLFAHNALDPFFGVAFWPLVWVSFSKSPVLEHYPDIFLGACVSHISPFTKPSWIHKRISKLSFDHGVWGGMEGFSSHVNFLQPFLSGCSSDQRRAQLLLLRLSTCHHQRATCKSFLALCFFLGCNSKSVPCIISFLFY